MKSINAKRIAAIAASLVLGMAVAGPVSFSSIPIINNAGQPVVQIVVGSTAMPSDGVVAANIAAVIGNLAYTSTPITATVGGTSGLTCVTTAPACTVSNASVYLGEKGVVTASGSYSFKALIGSVLNGAVLNYNNLASSKALQGTGQYTYPQYSTASVYPITSTPTLTSAFAGVGALNVPVSLQPSTNSGGAGGGNSGFNKLTNTGGFDNIVAFSTTQVPGLANVAGSTQDTEYLWFAGFPVFDQNSGVNNFQVLDPQGAYEAVFNNPPKVFSSLGVINHASFDLLGSSWTIFNATLPAVSSAPPSNDFVVGGKLQLAAASTPLTTVYVGSNLTSGPLTVTLQDLSYTNATGGSKAAIAVSNDGTVTNETSIAPGQTQAINSSGTLTYVYVQSTFAGLYSVQRWAKMQLFSSVTNVTSGKVFNNNPAWYAQIHWSTNQSAGSTPLGYGFQAGAGSTVSDNPNAVLEGIVLYSNQSTSSSTQAALSPGSTFQEPGPWKITFVGDSLGTPGSGNSNYDAISLSTSYSSSQTYTNNWGNTGLVNPTMYSFSSSSESGGQFVTTSDTAIPINETVVTEPVDLLTVSSTLPTAFQVQNTGSLSTPSSSSSVQYILDAYKFYGSDSLDSSGVSNIIGLPNGGVAVYLSAGGSGGYQQINGNYINPTPNTQTITVTGYKPGASTAQSIQVTFNGFNQWQAYPGYAFSNVINIGLPYDFPANGVTVEAYDVANTAAFGSGALGATGTAVSQQSSPALDGNTIILSYPSNIMSAGASSDTITAKTSNAANDPSGGMTITLSGGALATPSTVTYSGGGNSMTLNTNNLLPSSTPYTVNVVDTIDNVYTSNTLLITPTGMLLGTLSYQGADVAYKTSQYNYWLAPSANTVSGANVVYTAESASNVNFILAPQYPSNVGTGTYFTYSMPLITLPQSTTPNANVIVALTNSSTLLSQPMYWLNNTDQVNGGGNNALVYESSFGNNVKAQAGFRDERGGEVSSISTQSVVFDMATSVDTLQFLVGPSASNVTTTSAQFGPYGAGQATNIANVTIASVTGNCNFVQSSAGCTVSGISNLTATPTATQAITSVPLNTATTPLAVLDSNAGSTSTLILVGSKFVNSVSAQVFAQNPSLNSTFDTSSVVVQAFGTNRILVAGYTANQTVQAGNEFIQDLLTSAGTTT